MYPIEIVKPFKEELTTRGFSELLTKEDVDIMLQQQGTALVVINSVCGCAANNARPGALLAVQYAGDKSPQALYTAFAGYDLEAVQAVRDKLKPYPPSSPSIALFKDGVCVHLVERMHIEGSTAEMIAANLTEAFKVHC